MTEKIIINLLSGLKTSLGVSRGGKVFNRIIQMEADHLRENPQNPQQQSVGAWTQLKVAFYHFVSSGGLIVYTQTLLHETQTLLQKLLLFFPSNAFMASARSSNTFNCMLQIGRMVNWCKNGRLLIEWRQEWTGKGLVYSPVGRHKNATRKQKRANTKQTKNHKPNTKNSNNGPSQNKRDKYQFMS